MRGRPWYSDAVDVFQKILNTLGEDRYSVGRMLRAGAMSRVHEGRERRSGREVALMLVEGGSGDAALERPFRAEIRVLAELSHPSHRPDPGRHGQGFRCVLGMLGRT